MKKIIAGTVAVLALAAAAPLVADAGHERGDVQGMLGGHGSTEGMMSAGHHGGPGMKGRHHRRHGTKGHHGRMHSDRGGRMRLQEMLERYDADGDGSVSQAEVDAWRAARLQEFDTDGNGQLSLDEYEALWLDAMREQMVDQFQDHDDDGDGQVTVEEFGERTARMVMMRDRNDDGMLNIDDVGGGRMGDRGMGSGGMGDGDSDGEDTSRPAAGQPAEGGDENPAAQQ